MKHKVNEIQIRYREKIHVYDSPQMGNSENVAKLLHKNWNKDTIALHETFKILLLNNSNKVKGIFPLSTGGITGTMVDIRLLFAIALKTLSVGIILAHNHPSGQLRASKADIAITKKIKKAAQFFDMRILDHLIIVPNGGYYSFADNGLL